MGDLHQSIPTFPSRILIERKMHQNLKDKSGGDKIIVEKQPYQLLNTSRELFPSFHASNFHKLDD